jgi:prepilin-type N-terminal cleavage/methylation domain-containing protein
MPRLGFTLLEIIIALAIFALALAAVLESLTAARRDATVNELQTAATIETSQVLREIEADVARSGWHFWEPPSGSPEPVPAYSTAATLADDRQLRYYPFIRALTPNRDWDPAANPESRIEPADWAAVTANARLLHDNEFARLSPWTATRRPDGTVRGGWSTADIAADAVAIAQRLPALNVAIGEDVIREMASPSSELVFLRASTGPWTEDPAAADSATTPDMTFFTSYYGTGVPDRGALAWDWRQPAFHDSLPWAPDAGGALAPSVRHASEYQDDDNDGAFVHRNSAGPGLPASGPYGVQAWGAFLDDAASGLTLRIQWEAVSPDRMYLDPAASTDNLNRPVDLREFTFAVVPSPIGLGRLVRAHRVPKTGTPVAGVEIGDWLTDTSQPFGLMVDKVISEHVVRMTWVSRRHDRSLAPNQLRCRLVFARVSPLVDPGTTRSLDVKIVDQVFAMRARNEYTDQAEADISLGSNAIPFSF